MARIPLIEAAQRLGLSYNQALRLVLIGQLDGRRSNGRWLVDAQSVAEHKRRLHRGPRKDV